MDGLWALGPRLPAPGAGPWTYWMKVAVACSEVCGADAGRVRPPLRGRLQTCRCAHGGVSTWRVEFGTNRMRDERDCWVVRLRGCDTKGNEVRQVACVHAERQRRRRAAGRARTEFESGEPGLAALSPRKKPIRSCLDTPGSQAAPVAGGLTLSGVSPTDSEPAAPQAGACRTLNVLGEV